MPSVGRRPFTGSGGRYSPGPTTAPPLSAMSRPLDGTLAPPWALRRTSPVLGGEADSRRSLHARPLPTVSPADRDPSLGPRSLDPDRSFWSAYAELIRDQRSPADFCNENTTCEQTNRDPRFPRWDGGLDLPPVLTCHAFSLARAVTRGEPRCARTSDPSEGFSHLRGFAQP
jgi:hypothetical protein